MQTDLPKLLKEYLDNKQSYEDVAVAICNIQKRHNAVYRSYCDSIGQSGSITSIYDIPYLPISAFKHHEVILDQILPQDCVAFTSSGTTGSQVSSHYVPDVREYHRLAQLIFENQYDSLQEYKVYGLLPAYLERTGSSLVSMVDHFIKISQGGGFYLYNHEKLFEKLTTSRGKVLLIGVSFGLLDFAEQYQLEGLADLIVMETGGMKGRHREIPRSELHQILSTRLGVSKIHSEYGMTELTSQAYSQGDGIFDENRLFKIKIRDISDPFGSVPDGKSGVVCITDFGNLHSCAFIETEDLGRRVGQDQFMVLGRMDNSDLRGCNLMVE